MMEIFRSQSTPKVFVLATSIAAQEKISRALGTKPVHKVMASGAPRKGELQNVIPPNILERLDTEEARIVHLITLGLTAKEIGSALDVSIQTYYYRKKTIFEKLNISNRSELIELIRTPRIRIVNRHHAHSGPQSPMIIGPATAITRFATEAIPSAIHD